MPLHSTGSNEDRQSAVPSPDTSPNGRTRSGPRTPAGKARVALNSISHGIFARALVLPGVEQREDWEGHIRGVLESLTPVGHVETLLARRAGDAFWRLERLRRYEAAVLEQRLGDSLGPLDDQTAEMAEKFGGKKDEWEPDVLAERTAQDRGCGELLRGYPKAPDDTVVDESVVRWALHSLAVEAHVRLEDVSVPGLPLAPPADAAQPWTIGRFRKAVALIAHKSGGEPEALIEATIETVQRGESEWQERREWVVEQRERVQAKYLVPELNTLRQLVRYEAHLTRQLNHALHQLEVLQARRRGERVHVGSIWHGGFLDDPPPLGSRQ